MKAIKPQATYRLGNNVLFILMWWLKCKRPDMNRNLNKARNNVYLVCSHVCVCVNREELTYEMLILEPRASDDETPESEASIGTADSSENITMEMEGATSEPSGVCGLMCVSPNSNEPHLSCSGQITECSFWFNHVGKCPLHRSRHEPLQKARPEQTASAAPARLPGLRRLRLHRLLLVPALLLLFL